MGAIWDFVDADLLWQRPNARETFKRTRLADIDWGPRIGQRIQFLTRWNGQSEVTLITIGDLVLASEAELLRNQNFGRTSLNRVKAVLAEHGLQLKEHP